MKNTFETLSSTADIVEFVKNAGFSPMFNEGFLPKPSKIVDFGKQWLDGGSLIMFVTEDFDHCGNGGTVYRLWTLEKDGSVDCTNKFTTKNEALKVLKNNTNI